MDFEDILKDLVSVAPGAVAATLMGMDGIPLACFPANGDGEDTGGNDIEPIGVEYGKILGEIVKASEVLRLGKLRDVTLNLEDVNLEDVVVLMRLVTPEYFIALLLENAAMVGKARFVMKSSVMKARKQITE